MGNGDNKKVNQDERLFGALSYVWVLSVLILIMKKDSEFVKSHARQGLILFIATLFIWIPVIGWILFVLAVFLMAVGLIKALMGEKWDIPIIGSIAKKINL